MADNWLLIITLLLIFFAAVVLMARLLVNMRTSRTWMKDWKEVAKENGLTYWEMYGQSNITGMYQGRLIKLLGSVNSGTTMLIATNNWNNNHLEIKSKGLPPSSNPDPEAQFRDGLTIQSRSGEFSSLLFSSMELRRRLAPLARIPNLTVTLSGEELVLHTPAVIHKPADVVAHLDTLSTLATQIELIR
jgi:hypothetical protein